MTTANDEYNFFPFVPQDFPLRKDAQKLVDQHLREDHAKKQQELRRQQRQCLLVFIIFVVSFVILGVWAARDAAFLLGELGELGEGTSSSAAYIQKTESSNVGTSIGDQSEDLCRKGHSLVLRENYSSALQVLKSALHKGATQTEKKCDTTTIANGLAQNVEMEIFHYIKAYFYADQEQGYDTVCIWLAGKLGFLFYELDEFETSTKWFEVATNGPVFSEHYQAVLLSGYASSMASLRAGIRSNSLLKAYELHSRSLELFESLHDRVGTAQELSNAGKLLLRHSSALHDDDDNELVQKGYMLVNNGWKLQRDIGDLHGEALSLRILGERYAHLNRTEDALNHYQHSSYIYRRLKNVKLWAETISEIALVHVGQGNYNEAFLCYKAVLDKDRESRDIVKFALHLRHAGEAYVQAGNEYFDKAIELFQRSIDVFASIWHYYTEVDSLCLSLDDKARQTSKSLESLFFDLGRTVEALEVSEHSRGRSLEYLLARHREGIEDRHGSQNKLSYLDMRQLAERQDATILVYSFISATKVLAWVVCASSEEPSTAVIAREALPRGTIRYLRNRYETASDLRRCYDELILPVETAIRTGPRSLIIIPDGELFRVPFAALISNQGRHLIEDFVVRISSSIEAIHQLEKPRIRNGIENGGVKSAETALVVGDPRRNLPGSIREAQHAARTMHEHNIDPLLLLHENATKKHVLEAIKTSSYIHLSAHGGHDFVEMEGNSHLTMFDLKPASLHRARLVVLGACNTLKGKIRADGVYGLVRAFAAAGAPAIIATLWTVLDDDTLMRKFYPALFSAPTPADAFRQAVLGLIGEGTDHTIWSPYVMLYDAKTMAPSESTR